MDYLGDLMFIIFLIIFVVGSYVTSKIQKPVKNSEIPDVETEVFDTENNEFELPQNETAQDLTKRKRKNKRKAVEGNPNTVLQEAYAHENNVYNNVKDEPFEKFREPDNTDDDYTLDSDNLKKAVVYSEILNRKY
ncbi:MAG: hypothetical protein SOR57_00300 [Parabacteroides sp.]|nr:hypothetical protein [Parabacteroides sp.]